MPNEPSERETNLAEEFNVPDVIKELLKPAFVLLKKFEKDVYMPVVDLTIKYWGERDADEAAEISKIARISLSEAGRVSVALAMILHVVSKYNPSPEEFVDEGIKSDLLTEENNEKIIEILKYVIDQRSEIIYTEKHVVLENDVLPSLNSIDFAIDVRFSLSDDESKIFTPVIVSYVSTDVGTEKIWFQMGERQLRRLQDRIGALISDLENIKSRLRNLD